MQEEGMITYGHPQGLVLTSRQRTLGVHFVWAQGGLGPSGLGPPASWFFTEQSTRVQTTASTEPEATWYIFSMEAPGSSPLQTHAIRHHESKEGSGGSFGPALQLLLEHLECLVSWYVPSLQTTARRDSTGERSPFFPLKTRPDSPGESRMQP